MVREHFVIQLKYISSGAVARITKLIAHTTATFDCKLLETNALEVAACRGHANHVSWNIFHHPQGLIIAVAEDKCICVWDISKCTIIRTFQRKHDCFWAITALPELYLFTSGTFDYEWILSDSSVC